jgi:hypothetical protein
MTSGTRHFFFVQFRPTNERGWHDARDSNGQKYTSADGMTPKTTPYVCDDSGPTSRPR